MKAKKHLYDHIIYDSFNQNAVANKLVIDTNGVEYVTLSNGFYILSPARHCNSDCMITFYEGTIKYVYFVVEIKGSMN